MTEKLVNKIAQILVGEEIVDIKNFIPDRDIIIEYLECEYASKTLAERYYEKLTDVEKEDLLNEMHTEWEDELEAMRLDL